MYLQKRLRQRVFKEGVIGYRNIGSFSTYTYVYTKHYLDSLVKRLRGHRENIKILGNGENSNFTGLLAW